AMSQPGGRSVHEPSREQRALDTQAAVRGRGRRARELSDAVGDLEAGAADGDSLAQREVAHDAGDCEVTLSPLEDITGKVLMRGHTLCVGMGEAFRDDVKPGVELVLAVSAYLDSAGSDGLDLAIE